MPRPVGVEIVPRARPRGRARGSLPLSPYLLVVTQTGDAIPRSSYLPRTRDYPSIEGLTTQERGARRHPLAPLLQGLMRAAPRRTVAPGEPRHRT